MPTVLFDLFDTLVSLRQPGRLAQQEFADRLGLDLEAVRQWWKAKIRERMVGFYPTYPAIIEAMCKDLGSSVSEEVRQQTCKERDDDRTSTLQSVKPEVIGMLRQLRQDGWRIGILSNAAADEVAPWANTPLSPLVDDTVFSCHVGYMKPEREIYDIACSRLDVTPSEARFVGDGGFGALQAAASLGMPVIKANWFRPRTIEWTSVIDLVEVDDIAQVPQRLQSLKEHETPRP